MNLKKAFAGMFIGTLTAAMSSIAFAAEPEVLTFSDTTTVTVDATGCETVVLEFDFTGTWGGGGIGYNSYSQEPDPETGSQWKQFGFSNDADTMTYTVDVSDIIPTWDANAQEFIDEKTFQIQCWWVGDPAPFTCTVTKNEAKPEPPVEEPSIPFTDVKKGTWQYDTAEFVYKRGILTGTSATTFSPDDMMTRGQLVTMLWRMEGAPSVPVKDTYPDVAAGKYYVTAIQWAKNNGLVNGYENGEFGPDDPITRQQFVIILYRYAQYKGYSVAASGKTYTECSDYKLVSPSAVYCVEWGYKNGLIGSGKVLNPQGKATRIEVAAMLQRFINKFE